MRKSIPILTVILFILVACKKDNTPPTPEPLASFALTTAYLSNDTSQVIRLPVYEGFHLNNNSANADTYLWDFGNGNTSTDKSPTGGYTKPGTYVLRLTSLSKDGRKSVSSKTIKVVEAVAKQIEVIAFNPKSALGWAATYPTADKMNVWVEVLKKAAPEQQYPLSDYGIPLAPLVYKTNVAANVDATKLPMSFDISGKLVIDIPTYAAGAGYIFNLYGQDNTGTYLISSSYGSGVSSSMSGNILQNRFIIATGFDGSNLSLKGVYE